MDKKKKKISERTRTLFLFTLPSVVMYTVFFYRYDGYRHLLQLYRLERHQCVV